ncbi:MAG: hypothetical protein ACI38Z_06640 [Parafannyhessea sp.]|uniref:hypothetical protein n=1 Tax=Parafannyhessea sp. TaxID=2847324 RepID=UPI003F1101C2
MAEFLTEDNIKTAQLITGGKLTDADIEAADRFFVAAKRLQPCDASAFKDLDPLKTRAIIPFMAMMALGGPVHEYERRGMSSQGMMAMASYIAGGFMSSLEGPRKHETNAFFVAYNAVLEGIDLGIYMARREELSEDDQEIVASRVDEGLRVHREVTKFAEELERENSSEE